MAPPDFPTTVTKRPSHTMNFDEGEQGSSKQKQMNSMIGKTKDESEDDDEEDKKCPICLEDFSATKPPKNLNKCKHKFCRECWDEVLKRKPALSCLWSLIRDGEGKPTTWPYEFQRVKLPKSTRLRRIWVCNYQLQLRQWNTGGKLPVNGYNFNLTRFCHINEFFCLSPIP